MTLNAFPHTEFRIREEDYANSRLSPEARIDPRELLMFSQRGISLPRDETNSLLQVIPMAYAHMDAKEDAQSSQVDSNGVGAARRTQKVAGLRIV